MKISGCGDWFPACLGTVPCDVALWRRLLGAFLCAFAAGTLSAGELRIMPMGDSITYGSHSAATAGYRGPLYTLLTEAGYTNFKFVGTATDTPGTLPSDQQHHEGHSGWVIQKDNGKGMYEYLPTSFSTILGPHVILLHLGTNDAPTPSTFPDAVNRLDQLLDRISALQPSAHIILTSLLERTDNASYNTSIVTYYNPYLPSIAAAHAARGQKVHFYDMRPKVNAATELDDGLHPNAAGYAHMAEGWLEAISALVAPAADYPDVAPAVVSNTVSCTTMTGTVTLRFNTPLAAASANELAHYAVAPEGRVASAELSPDARTVTLSLEGLVNGGAHTLTVEGLANESSSATLAATEIAFEATLQPGAAGKVDELSKYELVYDLNILPRAAVYDTNTVIYAVDNHTKVGKFSRIAYYLELQKPNAPLQYVWVSMDAFTDDAGKIALPTRASGAVFQQLVSNLKVYSNVAGVPTGARTEGNIEFWPYNYTAARKLKLDQATDGDFDSDDTNTGIDNFGSMQVHDRATGTTLFAYNLWGGRNGNNGAQDLGIGNCPTAGKRDWTRAENSATYSLRHLQVYVMPDVADRTPPTLDTAVCGADGRTIVLTFSKPVAAKGLDGCFALSDGSRIDRVTRRADNPRVVELSLGAFAQLEGLTVTVTGLHDAAPCANAMPQTTRAVTAIELPAAITRQVNASLTAGYQLVYTLEFSSPVNQGWTANNAGKEIYTVDRTPLRKGFDRVAYFYELEKADGTHQYVWTSMKAFTDNEDYIGVPLKKFGKLWDVRVEDLEIASNVSGVSTGTGFNGAIEFGYGGFSAPANSGYAGASSSAYDFDDSLQSSNDYGCMQVHNLDAKQVVWDFGRWGRTGSYFEYGIGTNRAGGEPDYTFTENGHLYRKMTLHVLVRSTTVSPQMPARISANVPEAADYQLVYQLDLPVKGYFSNAASNALITAVNRAAGTAAFDRQAYFLELVPANNRAVTNWVWTSFDAVTTDPMKLTIPSSSSATWTFWQKVDHMNVFSNVSSIQTGTDIGTGNIEFHNKNFAGTNQLGIPGASASAYDFGDSYSSGGDHACMQVHNYGAKQTIWAINKFYRTGASDYLCLGIGNRPGVTDTDWLNANNARDYAERRLFVLARPKAQAVLPALTARRVIASAARDRLCVSFGETLPGDVSALASSAVLSAADVALVKAERSPAEGRDMILTLSKPLAPATAYTLTLTLNGAATTLAFTTPAAEDPAVLSTANIPERDAYELVYELPIPNQAKFSHYGADYRRDESRFTPSRPFDRVAYCLELANARTNEWVWVSFDAVEKDLTKIGLPSIERGILTWGYVENMMVYAGTNQGELPCQTGFFPRGNIEFCASNYGQATYLGLGNASKTLFDFDDLYSDDGKIAGCGSMQVHNPTVGETVFSLSSFGNGPQSAGGGVNALRDVSVGIGTGPLVNNSVDWTYAKNAAGWTVKNLYVLVRSQPAGATGDFLVEPEGGVLTQGRRRTLTLTASAPAALSYQWRLNGEAIPFADTAWLDLDWATAKTGVYDVVARLADGTSAVSAGAFVRVALPETLILVR